MSLIKWNKNQSEPFGDFFDWEHPMFGLSLLPRVDKGLAPFRDNWFPAVDVSEDDKNFFVKADLPGLKKEEISLSLEQDTLTIRGERKQEFEKKDKGYHRMERSYGVFERRLALGTAIDEAKVKASYKDGVLDLVLPKAEFTKSKRIEISE